MRKVELLPTQDCEAGYRPECVRDLSPREKGNTPLKKVICRLIYEKNLEVQ